MRVIRYSLESSDKSVAIVANIKDRFGHTRISLSRVRGWRREIIVKYLKLDPEWSDSVIRAQVCIEAVKCAKDKNEALKYIQVVQRLSKMEVHFWASKFLSNKKARRAWRIMYK